MQEKFVSPTALQGSGFSIDDAGQASTWSWRRGTDSSSDLDVLRRNVRLTSDTSVCFSNPDTTVQLREEHEMLHRSKSATETPNRTHGPRPRHRHGGHRPDAATSEKSGLLLFVLLIAQLMVILDITAVNIALPSLASDLQLTGSDISWTITSYSLIFGSLLLFGGRAADLLGKRRMFLTGLGIFTTSSFASAMAGSAGALFAARAGQGLGAAMLSPAALAIIMSAFQGSQRAKALAAWGAVGGAGAAIGVLVGGLLTEFTDWRMIFYVNIPLAAALAIAAMKIIPADTKKPRWKGLDLRGAILATTSLGAIVFAITQAEGAGWTSVQTHLFGLGGLAGLAAFAALERRTDTPLLRIERLADRAVGGGLFLMLAAGMTLLAHVGENGSYVRDVLPGMLVGGLGLGVAVVSVSIAILTGAREGETGMISGLNSTGHEIGGTVGIAIFSTIAAGSGAIAGPQAASGIAHAFIAAGLLAAVASLVAVAVLPRARHFVPKMRLNPGAMPSH